MQNIKTQFGFTKVGEGEKQPLVSEVFSSVATSYDLMNDAMSLGMHRLWKRAMVDQLHLRPGQTLLDVASGTGDIANLCLKRQPDLRIIATDINAHMLTRGQHRIIDNIGSSPFTYAVADGSALPIAANVVERISIAFGIRNIPDIPAALKEFYRTLKPGGKFVCMEFSKPSLSWLEALYESYSFNVIPWLGEKIGNDRAAYQYLVESIRTFPTQDQFATLIRSAGFERVTYTNLTGGIVAIHTGVKI